jgi:hypothetical protein
VRGPTAAAVGPRRRGRRFCHGLARIQVRSFRDRFLFRSHISALLVLPAARIRRREGARARGGREVGQIAATAGPVPRDTSGHGSLLGARVSSTQIIETVAATGISGIIRPAATDPSASGPPDAENSGKAPPLSLREEAARARRIYLKTGVLKTGVRFRSWFSPFRARLWPTFRPASTGSCA